MSVFPEPMAGEGMPALIAFIDEFMEEPEIEDRKLIERLMLSATLTALGLKFGRGGPP